MIDKTGTLTEGRPAVTAILPAAGWSAADVLSVAASVEQPSEHPLGPRHRRGRPWARADAERAGWLRAPAGRGVSGSVDGQRVLIGAARFLAEQGIDAAPLAAAAEGLAREGATAVFVGVGGALAGALGLADPIKPTTAAAIAALRAAGLRIVMLSGDNRATAEAIGRRLGITEVEAEVLPDGKGDVVARLRAEGRVVAMVATASMTLPPWPPPTWAWPWAPAPTWRSRAPRSPW